MFLSKNIKLEDKLEDANNFEESIKNNLSFPYGDRRQEYNYVIAENCDILVAAWDEDGQLEGVMTEANCPGGRGDFTPRDHEGMINWYPEEWKSVKWVFKSLGQSPCWLNKDEDGKGRDGLLDAISKHFMLAQGPGSTINGFNEDSWADTQVAYAGEIIVDLEDCTYWLNNDSGTYGPGKDMPPKGNKLFDVAEHFAGKLDIWPAYYYDAEGLDATAKSLGKDSTNRSTAETAISAEPSC